MKKILLAFALCCVFNVCAVATNSDAKLNDIEMIRKKINALKAERKNISKELPFLMEEMGIHIKKRQEFENKTKIPEIPVEKDFFINSLKNALAKIENEIKGSKCMLACAKIRHDVDKINVRIDKANVELIKAEIKAGKTPKIPLELANAVLKFNKSSLNAMEGGNKCLQASIKENEAKIKCIEASAKTQEAEEKSTANIQQIKRLEVAELELAEMMSRLKLAKALEETARIAAEGAETYVKDHCKPAVELRKIYLKFDKVVDKKDFVSFLEHEY